MRYYIKTLNDNGTGMDFITSSAFIHEITAMIDDCKKNGGTYFDVTVESDVSCFTEQDETRKPTKPEHGFINLEAISKDVRAPWIDCFKAWVADRIDRWVGLGAKRVEVMIFAEPSVCVEEE